MSNLSYVHRPRKHPNEIRFFHQFLDATVEKKADAEALIMYDMEKKRRAMTYKGIRDRSMWLARSLLSLDLSRGDVVLLIGASSIEYVISTFALSRIGINIVLIGPGGLTQDKMDVMKRTLQIKGVIFDPLMQDSQLEQLKKGLEQLIRNKPIEILVTMRDKESSAMVYSKEDLHVMSDLIKRGREMDLADLLRAQDLCQPDDPCVAYFTSGSTGIPKLLQCVSGNLSASLLTMPTVFNFQEQCFRDTTHTKLYIDRPMAWAGGFLTFIRICTGASYVWAPTAVALQASETAIEIMALEKCNVVFMGVGTIQTMKLQNLHVRYDLSKLECVIIAGQRYPLPLVDTIFQCMPSVSVLLGYGSAECLLTMSVVYKKEDFNPADYGKMRVRHGAEGKVIHDDGLIVPRGKVGEICFRSPYVFLEYIGNPDGTRQTKSATGWVHMADIGKMDDQGRIEVLGRKKDFIKRATVKIFPAEIENVLMQHEHVASAMVIGVPDQLLYEEICACVILSEEGGDDKASLAEVEAWCAEQWPPGADGLSLKPKYFIPVEKFPLGKTGKTDSNAMRKMAMEILGLKEI